MESRTRNFSLPVLPPGLLHGLLLGIVQSLLVALVPVEINTVFLLIILLILLLYLLVPFFARLNNMRHREQMIADRRIAIRIGLTCASLVIFSTIIVYVLSTSGVQVVESGGFLDFRLMADNFFSFVAVVLLNVIGLLLSLIGGWLGGLLGKRWRKEQWLYE